MKMYIVSSITRRYIVQYAKYPSAYVVHTYKLYKYKSSCIDIMTQICYDLLKIVFI